MKDRTNEQLESVHKAVEKAAQINAAAKAEGFDWTLIQKPPSRPTDKALYYSVGLFLISMVVIYYAAGTQAFPLLFMASLAAIGWVAFVVQCIYEQRFATILISIFGCCILLIASHLISPQASAEAFRAWMESLGKK